MTVPNKIKEKHPKHQELKVKNDAYKQKKNIRGISLVFALAFGLVIYFVVSYKDSWLGAINHLDPFGSYNKSKGIENITIKPEVSSKEMGGINDEDAPKNSKAGDYLPEEIRKGLVRFSPDDEEVDLLDDGEVVSPYDKEVQENMSNDNQVITSVNLVNDFDDYRIYLANVNELLQKLSKDRPYSENLDIIMQIQLPKEIQEIVEMCKLYNDMLVENAPPYEQILLLNTDIFDKFLKIKKETNAYKEMKQLKMKIENKIDLFTLYSFSVDLQEEFLK